MNVNGGRFKGYGDNWFWPYASDQNAVVTTLIIGEIKPDAIAVVTKSVRQPLHLNHV